MRIGIGLAMAALLWASAGCNHKESGGAQETRSAAPTVQMGDPRAAGQLVSGFYDIEGGTWRWTAKQFVVQLGTPVGANANGATLELQFTIPAVVIEKNTSVTLSAAVDGNALPPETYTKAGEYVYKRDVPANVLGGNVVKASFEVDKSLIPSGADQRVLGVVATSVRLVRK
jgi:hypothetical protein